MSGQHAHVACASCDGPAAHTSRVCRACYLREKAAAAAARRICPDCGQARYRLDAGRCRSCNFKRRRLLAARCMDCGGRKCHSKAQRCRSCHNLALRSQVVEHVNGLVTGFSAEAFRTLLERSDIEWPLSLLALQADVRTHTIQNWLNGRSRPRRVEWERVARVLALEACGHCGGNGWLDPTDKRVATFTAVGRSTPRALPRSTALEPVASGGLALEPNARSLTLGTRQLTLTQQEYRLLATIVRARGRYVTGEELAEAIWQPEQGKEPSIQAARMHLVRLRTKCERAGLRWPVVTVYGLGYRVEVAS